LELELCTTWLADRDRSGREGGGGDEVLLATLSVMLAKRDGHELKESFLASRSCGFGCSPSWKTENIIGFFS
jgi:hypothetical protein